MDNTETEHINVIIEANIPYSRSILEPLGVNVQYLAPQQITPEAMRHTDGLITRTRTLCNESLLCESRCSMIASATIGLDHVDIPWCEAHGIEVANAPGCNAPAVAQYVFGSIMALKGADLKGLTIGIVGVGHVGSIVARWAQSLGMNLLLCDPPRQEAEAEAWNIRGTSVEHPWNTKNSSVEHMFHEKKYPWNNLKTIAREADIITFHTPLTREGAHRTYHLCDAEMLEQCAKKPLIINAARGAVVHTEALVEALAAGKVSHAVIDCWENEPEISQELLNAAVIATPHIAGYSKQGKIRATNMAISALARHFNLPQPKFALPTPSGAPCQVDANEVMMSYNPAHDTHALKSAPRQFESLRNNYHLRNEVGFND